MNTCQFCRFWNTKEDTSYRSVPARECKAIPQIWDVTEWNEDYTANELRPEFADTLAFCGDGSSYVAYVLTLPNFACNMFKPKED